MEFLILVKKCFSWLRFLRPVWNYFVMWFRLPFEIKKMKKAQSQAIAEPGGFLCECCGRKMKIVKTEPYFMDGFEDEPLGDVEWAYFQCPQPNCFRHANLFKAKVAGVSVKAEDIGITLDPNSKFLQPQPRRKRPASIWD